MMSKSKKSKTNPDALFGELRSVLQQPVISEGTRTHMWGLCVRMYKFYPTQFASLWRPYLESYATHWQPEMVEITSANELKRAVKMMPTARFTLAFKPDTRWIDSKKRRQQVLELLRSPHIEAIIALHVTDHEQSQMFLTSPLLRALTRVHLRMPNMNDSDWDPPPLHIPRTSAIDLLVQVATSPHKDTLKLIEINHATSEDQGELYDALARLGPLPQLHTLILQDCLLTYRGLHALTRSGLYDNLEHLNISSNELTLEGIQEIANSSNLDHLRELSLLDVKLSLPMVECLATHPFFSRLEALHIQTYRLYEAQKHMLATSTTLKTSITQHFASHCADIVE